MMISNERKAIVWFRQDLRLHDNEALTDAIEICRNVIPVYVFDERIFSGTTHYGFPKTGPYRARFIWESVANLKENLRKKGSDLVIRYGKPEEEVFEIAREAKTSWVFCNRERTREEVQVQDALEENLWSIGQELRYYRGKMLYYTSDLPFPVPQTPDVFTHYRKEIEKLIPVRTPISTPEKISSSFKDIPLGDLPELAQFVPQHRPETDDRASFSFSGGEDAALARLKEYVWDSQSIATYKETRNELLGPNYSSKFSAYLAQGCLSPKMIYHEVEHFEEQVRENKSTYWMKFELMWRDFYRLMAKKYKNNIFLPGGPQQKTEFQGEEDLDRFHRWAHGKTGIPFIDANMREINQTGYMSNRGRQNVASYLIKDLNIHWRMGAEYFESLLIDYDPASNYGNWNYLAGVGADPMEQRYFNILSQAQRYDHSGDYVRHWLPELQAVSDNQLHEIYNLDESDWVKYDLHLNYYRPVYQPKW